MTKQINCNVIYANGDSWVFGSELRDRTCPESESDFEPHHMKYRVEHSWPTLLGDSYGLPVENGSMAGASNDYILRTTIADVSKLLLEGQKPFVVVSWTQLQRFELPIGPDGNFWRSFVSPRATDNPKIALDIWAEWSSDKSDLVKWIQQVILLDTFLKANRVPYFGTTVFKENYQLFEQHNHTSVFKAYMFQLSKTVGLENHLYNFSLESILRQYTDVEYGPGGHPLELGQIRLKEYLRKQIDTRFKIN